MAAGGRYDEFLRKCPMPWAGFSFDEMACALRKPHTPCVGVSFDVEKILTILQTTRAVILSVIIHELDVYIVAIGNNGELHHEGRALAALLREAGIRADYAGIVNASNILQRKEGTGVPVLVILSEKLVEEGFVRVRTLKRVKNGRVKGEGGEKRDEQWLEQHFYGLIRRKDLVAEVKQLL
ncbi:hypothetical protein F4808DRAFT_465100 [Astrocystis sublimbata]|nr:hypothetical protein F4808DRAFT_465100 [Astrocystis sublimbata]